MEWNLFFLNAQTKFAQKPIKSTTTKLVGSKISTNHQKWFETHKLGLYPKHERAQNPIHT
jgi:hypothetical protein